MKSERPKKDGLIRNCDVPICFPPLWRTMNNGIKNSSHQTRVTATTKHVAAKRRYTLSSVSPTRPGFPGKCGAGGPEEPARSFATNNPAKANKGQKKKVVMFLSLRRLVQARLAWPSGHRQKIAMGHVDQGFGRCRASANFLYGP